MKRLRVSSTLMGLASMAVLAGSPWVLAQGAVPTDPTATAQPSNTNTQYGSVSSQGSRGSQRIASASEPANSSPTPGASAAMMKDKIFLRKAAQGGMAEVQLGRLAAKQGTSVDVRKFGQKMIDDHQHLDTSLQPFMEELGVATPRQLNKEDQAEYEKLKGMSGDDFDREYLRYMRADHHQDLSVFREEAANTQDQDLRQAVLAGEKVIEEHTRLIDTLAAANDVPNSGK